MKAEALRRIAVVPMTAKEFRTYTGNMHDVYFQTLYSGNLTKNFGTEIFLALNRVVCADNRIKLRSELGKPCFHYRGEFDYWVWKIKFKQYREYLILTAKTKGTIINSFSLNPDDDLQFIWDLYWVLKPE